ncbi:uncharacterized protein G2W53_018441 [Senna tora]|uniref:Uncharacterized protein n=1 Tax=Senna tora TaxID=362788 RepID=A0A834TTP0_9FABA|nr:uncharacterized protein G2W53_018441 [Senna tora]
MGNTANRWIDPSEGALLDSIARKLTERSTPLKGHHWTTQLKS